MSRKTKNFCKWTLLVLGAFLLFSIFIYPVFTLFDRKDLSQVDIQKSVNGAFIQGEKTGDEIIAYQISILKENNIVIQKIASSKTDVCYFTNLRPEGSDHRQRCHIRYVEGFTTQLTDKESIIAKLRSVPEIYSYDVENNDKNLRLGHIYKDSSTCNLYSGPNAINVISISFIFADSSIAKNSESGNCEVPNQFPQKYALYVDNLTSRGIHSFEPIELDYSKNQLWITLEQEYYDEKLRIDFPISARIRKAPVMADYK